MLRRWARAWVLFRVRHARARCLKRAIKAHERGDRLEAIRHHTAALELLRYETQLERETP